MAIKIEYSTRFGDTYAEAYARIVNLTINYASKYAEASIGIYKSEEARELNKEPVLIEKKRYVGEQFEEFFKELSLDNIDASISPVADIYNSLTVEEGGKYEGGLKVYDEKTKEEGVIREVSKDEKLRIEL